MLNAGFSHSLWLAETRSLGPFLGWLGLAIAVIVLAGSVLVVYRRRVLGESSDASAAGMMERLRVMRDAGRISPEEYDAARRAMVGRIQGKAERPAARPPPQGERVAAPGFDLTGAPLPRPPERPEV